MSTWFRTAGIIALLITVLIQLPLLASAADVPGEKVIPGVEPLQWGQDMDNTFIGALTVAMRAMGEDVTYDYLMGASGAAFRFHFFESDWCPSSADATVGFNCADTAFAALGYNYRLIFAGEGSPEAAGLLGVITSSIDLGRPVLAIDLKVAPDWGVITGYEEGGAKLPCRTYYDYSSDYGYAEKQPWLLAVVGDKGEAPVRAETLRRSLGLAVELARAERYGDYLSGFTAMERWITDLEGEARFEFPDSSTGMSYNHINAWIYYSLMHSRQSASRYLQSIQAEFPPEAAGHLANAATIYGEIAQVLEQNRKYAPYEWELPEGGSWDHAMRMSEAQALRQVLEMERAAIAEIEAAL